MALTKFGEVTKTLFLKGIEMHKLHHEFEVGEGSVVKKGQPVVLNSDGTVKPAAVKEPRRNIIGYSIHNGEEEEYVTVGMKAFGIVWATPKAPLEAGPVAYDGMAPVIPATTPPTTTMYSSFVAASTFVTDPDTANVEDDMVGWALDEAVSANDLIRVAIY